jgi:hypothetical protein
MSVYPTNSTFDRLQMPSQPHVIPPNPRVLGAYATPKANTLMPLFLLLFGLIFELLRRRSHVRIVLGRPDFIWSVPDTWFTSGTDHMVYTCYFTA